MIKLESQVENCFSLIFLWKMKKYEKAIIKIRIVMEIKIIHLQIFKSL